MRPFRAVICDIYKTVLEVGEPPADSEQRWSELYQNGFGEEPAISLRQLSDRCDEIVSEDHEEARARGICHPEVNWPLVMNRALPELARLASADVDDFLFQHAQLLRALRMMRGCAPVLHECIKRGILLGIASNAQAYTLRELGLALSEVGLSLSIFESDLTFWSFQHGFSKPNPHVFQILRARLHNRRIRVSETLMIGDREDNDIAPAKAAGWHTWQISNQQNCLKQGDWNALGRALFE